MPAVYTRLLFGSTSLPATMSMTSLCIRSSSCARSFSPTCTSPFLRISSTISSRVMPGNDFLRSSFDATWPLLTLRNTLLLMVSTYEAKCDALRCVPIDGRTTCTHLICSTSSKSSSLPLRYELTLFLYAGTSNRFLPFFNRTIDTSEMNLLGAASNVVLHDRQLTGQFDLVFIFVSGCCVITVRHFLLLG